MLEMLKALSRRLVLGAVCNLLAKKIQNSIKYSRVDKFSEKGMERERERPPGWGKGQEGKGRLQALRSKEAAVSNVEGGCR